MVLRVYIAVSKAGRVLLESVAFGLGALLLQLLPALVRCYRGGMGMTKILGSNGGCAVVQGTVALQPAEAKSRSGLLAIGSTAQTAGRDNGPRNIGAKKGTC